MSLLLNSLLILKSGIDLLSIIFEQELQNSFSIALVL